MVWLVGRSAIDIAAPERGRAEKYASARTVERGLAFTSPLNDVTHGLPHACHFSLQPFAHEEAHSGTESME